MRTKRCDERGGDVDAALVELPAAKRHVREVQQACVLIHVEVGNGLSHFVAVQQDVAGGFVDHAFRECGFTGRGQAEEPECLSFDFYFHRELVQW